MWLVQSALRRPIAVLVGVVAVLFATALALPRMPCDLFPALDRPVLYLVETWPGMTPAQMEGLIAARFEYHFLYLAGIEHIETRTIANTLLTKLFFQPDTDTSYAVAQTVAMAYRATATMPKGTPPPFIMRLDAGSHPIADLVFESPTRSDSELQDIVASRIRPLLATMPGVSSPPPIGGAPPMVMVSLDPARLRRYGMSPDEVVDAIAGTNLTLPKGSTSVGGQNALVEANFTTDRPEQLDDVPLRVGRGPTVYVRDVGRAELAGDVLTNRTLVDGHRAVHMPVTKRAGASSLGVVDAVRRALPDFRAALPGDVGVRLVFDRSDYIVNAIRGLFSEAVLGAVLTGAAVVLFLRDARSAGIVILSIPISILAAVVVLSLAGESINVMTMGGLVLAVGVLVDEATVAIENVHVHLAGRKPAAIAVRDAMREVQAPRLVAVLCICAVFIPALYMTGTPRALFGALALAVATAMAASFVVASTVVPVLSVWFLRVHAAPPRPGPMAALRRLHSAAVTRLVARPVVVVAGYLGLSVALVVAAGRTLPREFFPRPDTRNVQLRVRAPAGTDVDGTEALVRAVLAEVSAEVGPGGVAVSVADVGSPPPLQPSDAVFVFNPGPDEAVLLLELANGRASHVPELEEALRRRLRARFPEATFTFERADVMASVLAAGSTAPVDVVVIGQKLKETRQYAERVRNELAAIPAIRDLAIGSVLDAPSLQIHVDRWRAAQLGVTAKDVGRALAATDWSSQMVAPLFWTDARGSSYFVSVRGEQAATRSLEDVKELPVMAAQDGDIGRPLLRDVATVEESTTPGEYPHWDSRRCLHVLANGATSDLAGLARDVRAAVSRASSAQPADVRVLIRGEIQQMEEASAALQRGFVLAIVVILLLLTATFQSVRSAVAVVLVIPAVLAGAVGALASSGTSLNVESGIGAIMAVGVAMANSVLLVQGFHDRRGEGMPVDTAALHAAASRLRAVLMTSLCMLAGMAPMALGIGESGRQNAPLGRAVVGGLAASTLVTLLVLPAILAVVHKGALPRAVSFEPVEPDGAGGV